MAYHDNDGKRTGRIVGGPPTMPRTKIEHMPTRSRAAIRPPAFGRVAAARTDEAVAAICDVIARIPPGWVATYGQVAAMAGLPRRARLVGRVLQQLDPAMQIPWHRVVGAKGEVSYAASRNGSDALQRQLLEDEGVEFDDRGRLDLERFRWLD